MKSRSFASSAALISILSFLLAGGEALAGGGNNSTGPSAGDPPTAPTFTGATVKNRPCTWEINLSSTDVDDDLNGFQKVDSSDSKLPPHHSYKSEGQQINGSKICNLGTWSSQWKAFDHQGNTSAASTLTLKCNRDPQNAPPSAPVFSPRSPVVQGAPCAFSILATSSDSGGAPVTLDLVNEGCLPPGHSFDGNFINSNGNVVGPGEWKCDVRATDNRCEQSTSTLTMTCRAAAPAPTGCAAYPIGSPAFDACCQTSDYLDPACPTSPNVK